MGWYLIIATIPIGVVGLAFKDQIENGARNLYLIGTVLIVPGIVLAVADRIGPQGPRARPTSAARDAIWIGIAQAFALDPGHLALGRDDHRGPLPRHAARGGRPLLVPALGPGRRAQRPLRPHRAGLGDDP